MARLRLRSDLLLVLACIALYVGAAAQTRTPRGTALSVAVATVTAPVLAAANTAGNAWEDFLSGQRDLRATLAQLTRLEQEVGELRRVNQLLVAEVAALRQGSRLLAAFPSLADHAVLADVVARDLLGSNTVRLDKGSADGIHVDCAVLAEQGVLGRIDLVTPHTSRVQLLSHPSAAAAARIVGIGDELLLLGGKRLTLTGLPPYTSVPTEAPVVTTGSEGIYPPGLLLGTTGTSGNEGMFTVVEVNPAVHPADTAVVLVICNGRKPGP